MVSFMIFTVSVWKILYQPMYAGHSSVFKILCVLILLNFLISSLKCLRALIMVKSYIFENTAMFLDVNIWSAF